MAKAKRITPEIFNMVRKLDNMEQFKTMNADSIFKYCQSLHAIIANELNNGTTEEGEKLARNILEIGSKLPVERRIGGEIAFNAPLFYNIHNNAHPVIAIDNQELIAMLRDTDVNADMLQRVQMPFDDFLVCFEYRGWYFETVAARIRLDSSYMLLNDVSLAEGDMFYIANGYMYRRGGKRPVVEIYDIDVSTTNSKFEFFSDMPDNVKEIMLEASRIFNGLFLYLSTPRAFEYINKKRPEIRRALRNINKSSQPAYLFNDIRYRYETGGDGTGTGGNRKAHLVRGHFRKQPYGPRDNPQYRTKFIEPYWTTGEGESESKTYRLN